MFVDFTLVADVELEGVEPTPLMIGFDNNPNDGVLETGCDELSNSAMPHKPQITSSDVDCRTTVTHERLRDEEMDVPGNHP